MRVIYGNEVNTTVPDGSDPQEILGILRDTYAALANAEYNVASEGGEQVMRITLKSGSKA
jgi:hypothetical protein